MKLGHKRVKQILVSAGIEVFGNGTSENDFRIRCPHPEHSDTNPSCNVRKEDGIFYCFSCNATGDIVALISLVRRVPRSEAMKMAYGDRSLSTRLLDSLRDSLNDRRVVKETVKLPTYVMKDVQPLQWKGSVGAYLKGRGINRDTVKRFTILENCKQDQVVFPVFLGGRIIGQVARSINTKRYLNNKGFPAKHAMYGVDLVQSGKPVVITEGIFNVLKIWQAGYHAVAILGSAWNAYKCSRVVRARPSSYIMFHDNDEAGTRVMHRVVKDLLGYGPVSVVDWTGIHDKGDAGDLSERQIKKMIQEAGRVSRYNDCDDLRTRLR